MNFIVSATTDIGISRATNQDSFCVKAIRTRTGNMVVAVLCDGMGGLEHGEIASASVVNAFSNWIESRLKILSEEPLKDSVLFGEWNDIITEFNEKIKLYGKKNGFSLGTTITALLLTNDRYYIANVGDTRAYVLKDSIVQMTKDHTLVEREKDQGFIKPEDVDKDSRRSVLLQCIGASETVYPDFFTGEITKDAVYMLCTDGFRHEITEQELLAHLNPSVMLDEDGMKANMEYLIDLNKVRGEMDNITVITVRTF